MAKHFMNKQRGEHMEGHESTDDGGEKEKPSIHIHSHAKGHTVQIDGQPDTHEFEPGDIEGISSHIKQHLGGGEHENEDDNESADVMDDIGGYGHGV